MMTVAVVVLVGCGKHDNSSQGTGSQSASESIPADPSGDGSDSAAEDASCPTENTTSFAKTKFVAHSGLAFGAFHRYLWKPYQAGTFKKGANGRISAFVKGGLSALFVKREVRLALVDVKANPTLCKAIAAPLAKVGDTVQHAFDSIKSGDASGLSDLNSAIGSVESSSKSDGVDITEDENADVSKKPN